MLAGTGHLVETVPADAICARLEEPWDLVIADLSAIGAGACKAFPPISEETRGVGIITHQDVILRPRWEEVGFKVVFRADFFSEPERYLFP